MFTAIVVEGPYFLDNRLSDDGEVVSLMRRPRFISLH
jgi:hypothetical protein